MVQRQPWIGTGSPLADTVLRYHYDVLGHGRGGGRLSGDSDPPPARGSSHCLANTAGLTTTLRVVGTFGLGGLLEMPLFLLAAEPALPRCICVWNTTTKSDGCGQKYFNRGRGGFKYQRSNFLVPPSSPPPPLPLMSLVGVRKYTEIPPPRQEDGARNGRNLGARFGGIFGRGAILRSFSGMSSPISFCALQLRISGCNHRRPLPQ